MQLPRRPRNLSPGSKRRCSRRFRRRPPLGLSLIHICNWLTDFSSLDERPPTDVKVWGEFMVYAYLFGVADQAIKQLQTTMPQLFWMTRSASMKS